RRPRRGGTRCPRSQATSESWTTTDRRSCRRTCSTRPSTRFAPPTRLRTTPCRAGCFASTWREVCHTRPFPAPCPYWTGSPTTSRRPQPSRQVERSEEHTSELQSRGHLVCRLLLEKKKT